MAKLRQRGWKIVSDHGFSSNEINFEDASLNEGFERVRSAEQTQVYRFFRDGRCYYYKTYTELSPIKVLKDLFRGIWNERALRIHLKLVQAGIKVPRIVCTARRGMCGVAISEEAPGETLLDGYKSMPVDQRAGLMGPFGRIVGHLHRNGFSHGDLRWGNVITQGSDSQWEFVFLDNERTMAFSRLPWSFRKTNLVQVRLSGILNNMPESEWDSFFESYCSAGNVSRKNSLRWDESIKKKAMKRALFRRKKKDKNARLSSR